LPWASATEGENFRTSEAGIFEDESKK